MPPKATDATRPRTTVASNVITVIPRTRSGVVRQRITPTTAGTIPLIGDTHSLGAPA